MALRIGIWGGGGMARQHAGQLARRDDAQLVAVCTRQRAAAEALLAEHGAPGAVACTDLDQLIAQGLDACYVCVPPGVHGGEVERLAQAGIHLLLEKPLTLDAQRLTSIADAVRASGVISQVGFHYRFKRGTQRVTTLREEGRLGRPVLFDGRFWCRFDPPAWWRDPALGGGQLVEQAIHLYDLAVHLFGPVAEITTRTDRLVQDAPDYQVEDTSVSLLRFADGALGTIHATTAATPQRFIGDWRAAWSEVAIDAASDGDWRSTDQTELRWVRDGGECGETIPDDADPYAAESDDFLRAIAAARPAACPVADVVHSHQLVYAALRSAAAGGAPTPIPEA